MEELAESQRLSHDANRDRFPMQDMNECPAWTSTPSKERTEVPPSETALPPREPEESTPDSIECSQHDRCLALVNVAPGHSELESNLCFLE